MEAALAARAEPQVTARWRRSGHAGAPGHLTAHKQLRHRGRRRCTLWELVLPSPPHTDPFPPPPVCAAHAAPPPLTPSSRPGGPSGASRTAESWRQIVGVARRSLPQGKDRTRAPRQCRALVPLEPRTKGTGANERGARAVRSLVLTLRAPRDCRPAKGAFTHALCVPEARRLFLFAALAGPGH